MSYDTNTSVRSRVINAFFDTAGAARKAVDDLVAAGIPREHISQTDGRTAGESVTTTASETGGFWEALKDLFLPEEDRYTYAEGLRRGGYLVSIRADEANYNRALDILDSDGAVNMDERESQWRSEGWSGYSSGSAAQAATTVRSDAAASAPSGMPAGRGAGTFSSATPASLSTGTTTARPAAAGTSALAPGRDEVIPVYEERLNIGKRDVSHGRVRVRSYVVETPVSEQVSLRSENVTIDRRPVDRPVTGADALFQDRVIEAEERSEEAVIAKEARVKEEITLRKTADTQTRTVSDTVRSTKVEIEDGRSAGSAADSVSPFSARTDASRIVEHMDVISADGQKIGTVDHLDGPDRIKLAKTTSPDGQHHFVPFTWIDHIDRHVHLKRTLADIKADPSTHGW